MTEPRVASIGGQRELLLLTRKEAAHTLHISLSTLDRLYLRGRIPVVKIGTLTRFRPEDLERFAAAHLQPEVEQR